jgi:uncharacterized protein YidB (DUF937 family)
MSDMMGQVLGALLGGQGRQAPGQGGLSEALGGLLGGGDRSVQGLEGIAAQLRQAGLGPQVDSWIGTGANEPVAPEALVQAFGQDEMDRLGRGSGVGGGALAGVLAAVLPAVINAMTPQGRVPRSAAEMPGGGGLAALFGGQAPPGGGMEGMLGALGGLLGGAGLGGGGIGSQGGQGGGLGGTMEDRGGAVPGAAYGKHAPGQSGGWKK